MVGTTFRHNQIALSLATALRPSLKGGNRKLPSLKEIVLVWQDRRLIEIYRRADIGWTHLVFEADDVVKFESVNAAIPVSTIYEDTDVP